MDRIFYIWKHSLRELLEFYEHNRGSNKKFFPKLFLFFIVVNVVCYWFAMTTAFPELLRGDKGAYYFKIQFPVGILGALFDSLSFFVTIVIIRRALVSRKNTEYVAHLSLDFVIAVIATFWVLFVFSFSGWVINLFEASRRTLSARNEVYEQMLVSAVSNPTENLRNIYFGILIGISAMIPTTTHIVLFIRASILHAFKKTRIS